MPPTDPQCSSIDRIALSGHEEEKDGSQNKSRDGSIQVEDLIDLSSNDFETPGKLSSISEDQITPAGNAASHLNVCQISIPLSYSFQGFQLTPISG